MFAVANLSVEILYIDVRICVLYHATIYIYIHHGSKLLETASGAFLEFFLESSRFNTTNDRWASGQTLRVDTPQFISPNDFAIVPICGHTEP